MINIVNKNVLAIGVGTIAFWAIYDYYVKRSYYTDTFSLYLFSIICVSGFFALLTRIIGYLFFRLQSNEKIQKLYPEFYKEVLEVLQIKWDPKSQWEIKDQLNSIFDFSIFIPHIYYLLKYKDRKAKRISQYLSNTMQEYFQLKPDKNHNLEVAQSILETYEKYLSKRSTRTR